MTSFDKCSNDEMEEKSMKIQECLKKYADLKQRFMGVKMNQNFTLIQNEQQLESVLESYSLVELNQYMSVMTRMERNLIACEEKAQQHVGLTPSPNNSKETEQPDTSGFDKEEKKRRKLLKKCLQAYDIYDDRCERLKPFISTKYSNRATFKQTEIKLNNASIEELKKFKEKVDKNNWYLWNLEQLYFPDVLFLYFEEDCLTKPFKTLWKWTKRIFCCVKSEDK